MLARIKIWLHHLLDPHCIECKVQSREAKVCRVCNELREILVEERLEKRKLVDTIALMVTPKVEEVDDKPQKELKPLLTRKTLSQAIRIKENEERVAINAIKNAGVKQVETSELEDKLGISANG